MPGLSGQETLKEMLLRPEAKVARSAAGSGTTSKCMAIGAKSFLRKRSPGRI
jgi:hypothetical protein